ncbi:MAG: ABC transporter permease, partial [Micavibrio aeruginosavorus]
QLSLPEVRFDDVFFSYEETSDKALNGISFIAQAGKVTALVGPSGGGKSTILNLLLRFYEPDNGAVKIDGIDLRDIKIPSLRHEMALVSQDITIFDDTLAANIAYGTQNASMDQIEEAARKAAAHEFIARMPGGFMTLVGENGVRLSGGQKQRIALARAILRNAPILLLDEATSALDNESERLIQQSLRELEKDRTTIVIAHRLSTIQSADQILVLDRGTIAEQGRHEELLSRNGIYTRMYNSAKANGEAA